jgi:hypothetical protein
MQRLLPPIFSTLFSIFFQQNGEIEAILLTGLVFLKNLMVLSSFYDFIILSLRYAQPT